MAATSPSLSARRILRDWREMESEDLPGIFARPRDPDLDLYTWDCVLMPHSDWPKLTTREVVRDPTSFYYVNEPARPRGARPPPPHFHFTLNFPRNFPTAPLRIRASSFLPHPNVYPTFICLDLLQEAVHSDHGGYTGGWSPAYTVQASKPHIIHLPFHFPKWRQNLNLRRVLLPAAYR